MLFSEASSDQIQTISNCLAKFCATSGAKVSLHKTKIIFSKNVSPSLASEISSIGGFEKVNHLGKYLGVPLFNGRTKKADYAYIIEKVRSRLSGRKCKSLSLAGHLTLMLSILAALPNYTMQTSAIPKGFCDELDKLIRQFLWGCESDNPKIHLVKWETVCNNKLDGGIGLKPTYAINQAFFVKLGWHLLTNPEAL